MPEEQKGKILFAHSGGAQGGPGEGSFDLVHWLRTTLGPDFEVDYSTISNPAAPTYSAWKSLFDQAFPELPAGSFLVGHSLGGSMLLKYLSESRPGTAPGGLFLIASPFWGAKDWDVEEFKLVEDFGARLPEIPNVYLYHSLDDPIVPFDHSSLYVSALSHATMRRIQGDEHAFGRGLTELTEDIQNIVNA